MSDEMREGAVPVNAVASADGHGDARPSWDT